MEVSGHSKMHILAIHKLGATRASLVADFYVCFAGRTVSLQPVSGGAPGIRKSDGMPSGQPSRARWVPLSWSNSPQPDIARGCLLPDVTEAQVLTRRKWRRAIRASRHYD